MSHTLPIRIAFLSVGMVFVSLTSFAQGVKTRPKEAPPVSRAPVSPAVPACRLVLKAMGEPVPGAEVYIEQGTGQEPIAPVTIGADGAGSCGIRKAGTYKFSVNVGPEQIRQLKKAAKGDKASLVLAITVGKKTIIQPVELHLTNDLRISGGPYSQSISNIPDEVSAK